MWKGNSNLALKLVLSALNFCRPTALQLQRLANGYPLVSALWCFTALLGWSMFFWKCVRICVYTAVSLGLTTAWSGDLLIRCVNWPYVGHWPLFFRLKYCIPLLYYLMSVSEEKTLSLCSWICCDFQEEWSKLLPFLWDQTTREYLLLCLVLGQRTASLDEDGKLETL